MRSPSPEPEEEDGEQGQPMTSPMEFWQVLLPHQATINGSKRLFKNTSQQ